MSTSRVATKSFNEEETLEGGKKAYENGISVLNELCEPYGKGENATGARSITADDIDRVTGYDKTKYYKYGHIEIGRGQGFDYQDVYHDDLSGLKVKHSYYFYYLSKYLSSSSKEYNMLYFGADTWLATRWCDLDHISENIVWRMMMWQNESGYFWGFK